MSGVCGCGRPRNPARARQRVEDCLCYLHVRTLLPHGRTVDGLHGIAHVGSHSIAYRVVEGEEQAIDVAYIVNNGTETITRRQRIALIGSWPRFEGCGWWFRCSGCGRRVAKLYLPTAGSWFSCRRCSALQYRSAQEHDARVDRLRREPALLLGILCGEIAASETERTLALKAVALPRIITSPTRSCRAPSFSL